MNLESTTSNEKLRVLVVEDESRLREVLAMLLRECECDPAQTATAEDALARLAQEQFDGLILDLHLPHMDGMSFMRTLRQQGDATPIIILSAHGTLEHAQEAIRLGVVEFLTKPCHLVDLERAVGRIRMARAAELPSREWETEPTPHRAEDDDLATGETLARIEEQAIKQALERHDGNKSAAAKDLGISRRTLYNKLDSMEP